MKKPVKNYYYDIETDLNNYPDAFLYVVYGGRNTGKTYSSLKYVYKNNIRFIFLKRTIEDVKLLCSGSGRIGTQAEFRTDLSPFKSINRDLYSDVRAYAIRDGLGAFYEHHDGVPDPEPIGYLLALSAVSKFKGFDLSECDVIIFDEATPNVFDKVNRREGEQLLELIKTVSRDREHRGKDPLKVFCLSNATNVSCPVNNTFEITDQIAICNATGQEYSYDPDKGIMIHLIHNSREFDEVEHNSKLYRAMKDTQWGHMAYNNEFGYNDFSSVGRTSIKGYRPVCSVIYKTHHYYIYQKDGYYYMCRIRHNGVNEYDLNKENDQKKFFFDYQCDIRDATIEGKALYEQYTMYDLIVNYRQFFKL